MIKNKKFWKKKSAGLPLMRLLIEHIPFHRVVRLRRRYLLTKTGGLRLRYVAGTIAAVCAVFTGFTGAMHSSSAFAPASAHIAQTAQEHAPAVTLASVSKEHTSPARDDMDIFGPPDDSHHRESSRDVFAMDTMFLRDMTPREEVIEINAGDTLTGALQDLGVGRLEAWEAAAAMSKSYDARAIKPGQSITVRLEPGTDGMELAGMHMPLGPTKDVVVTRDEKDGFSSKLDEKTVFQETKAAKTTIRTSLYGSAERAGIPASVIAEIIRVYSYDVDFQRDVRRGDTVEVFYETYETEEGHFAHYGDILYASLTVQGKTIPVWRYQSPDGKADYYREDGVSLKRLLMQTPIDGARISSGYGMRRHPVLGYNKMHKGIDFAAPRGTPIYAAGDGVVEKSGRNGGYGNYIRINHKNGLKTAYAHMHKFAKGVKSGKNVKQGQVIGYVGSTGRSTGPHLHFEVLRNNKHVNPKSIKSFSGRKLAGRELEAFRTHIKDIKRQYAARAQGTKFARNAYAP